MYIFKSQVEEICGAGAILRSKLEQYHGVVRKSTILRKSPAQLLSIFFLWANPFTSLHFCHFTYRTRSSQILLNVPSCSSIHGSTT